MEAIKFEHANITFAENQPEYTPLPALKIEGPEGVVVSCWKLSPEEIKTISETGVLWLSMMTFNHPLQPIFLSVNRDEVYKVNTPVGKCKICGCTESNPCYHPEYGTCWWVNEEQDLCSHCSELLHTEGIERPTFKMTVNQIRQVYLEAGLIPVRYKQFYRKGSIYIDNVAFTGNGWNKTDEQDITLEELVDKFPDKYIMDEAITKNLNKVSLFEIRKNFIPEQYQKTTAEKKELRFFGVEITKGGKWQIFELIDENLIRVKSIKPFASKKLAEDALEEFLATQQNYRNVNCLASM